MGSFTVGIEVTHKIQTSHGLSIAFPWAKAQVELQLLSFKEYLYKNIKYLLQKLNQSHVTCKLRNHLHSALRSSLLKQSSFYIIYYKCLYNTLKKKYTVDILACHVVLILISNNCYSIILFKAYERCILKAFIVNTCAIMNLS